MSTSSAACETSVIVTLQQRLSNTEKQVQDLTSELRKHLFYCKCETVWKEIQEASGRDFNKDCFSSHSHNNHNSINLENNKLTTQGSYWLAEEEDEESYGPVYVKEEPLSADDANVNVDVVDIDKDSVPETPGPAQVPENTKEGEVIRVLSLSDNESESEEEEEGSWYSCTECDEMFSNKQDLKKHKRNHRKRPAEGNDETCVSEHDESSSTPKKALVSVDCREDSDNDDNDNRSDHQRKVLSWTEINELIEDCMKNTDSHLSIKEEHNILHRLIVTMLCPRIDPIYCLFEGIEQSVGCLEIHCKDERIDTVWSMFKIFEGLPRLYQLMLTGNNLRLDWTIPSSCAIPISNLSSLIISIKWSHETLQSFEFGNFLNLIAPELKTIRFYPKLQQQDLNVVINYGYPEISNMIYNISKLNASSLSELQFGEDISLIDSRHEAQLDYSPLLSKEFFKLRYFVPPPYFPSGDEDHALRIEMALCQVIGNMPQLTTLNMKNVFLPSSFSITFFRCPTLTDITCNELAFNPTHVSEFEDMFPNLKQLVVWSTLTIFMEQKKGKPLSNLFTFLKYRNHTSTNIFHISHSKLKVLKLSFNHKETIRTGFHRRFPSLEQLELHLTYENYLTVLNHFAQTMEHFKHLNTLTLSANVYHGSGIVPLESVLQILAGVHPSFRLRSPCRIQKLVFEGNDPNLYIHPEWIDLILKIHRLRNLRFSGMMITNFREVVEVLGRHRIRVNGAKMPLRSGFCN